MGQGQSAGAGDTENITDGGIFGVEMEAMHQLANFSDCGGMTRKARDDREVEAERVAEPSCMILGSAVIFTPGRKRN